MSAVSDLVDRVTDLLTRSEEMASKVTGNAGQTPKLMTERAGILATLAVTTAISGQQAAATETNAVIAEAQKQLAAIAERVTALESGRQTLAVAIVDLGALAIGSRDYTVDWGKNLGDASYQIDLVIDDVLLGRATASVKTTGPTSAVITVRTALGVLTATKLQARAWRGL